MPFMVLLLMCVAILVAVLGVLAVTAALAQISDLPFPEPTGPQGRKTVRLRH